MKKILLILAVVLFAYTSNGQLLIKQVAFGAKAIDSIVGGAPAGGTTKYYYLNMKETVAASIVKSTTPVTNYSIYAVSINIALPTKAADVCDSTHFWIEISYDNANWYKWANVASSSAMYPYQQPNITGGAAYSMTAVAAIKDMIRTTTTAAGALFIPSNCYAPYSRIAVTTYKASSSAYMKAYYVLKPIN